MSVFNFATWDTEGEAYKKHHLLKGKDSYTFMYTRKAKHTVL